MNLLGVGFVVGKDLDGLVGFRQRLLLLNAGRFGSFNRRTAAVHSATWTFDI